MTNNWLPVHYVMPLDLSIWRLNYDLEWRHITTPADQAVKGWKFEEVIGGVRVNPRAVSRGSDRFFDPTISSALDLYADLPFKPARSISIVKFSLGALALAALFKYGTTKSSHK